MESKMLFLNLQMIKSNKKNQNELISVYPTKKLPSEVHNSPWNYNTYFPALIYTQKGIKQQFIWKISRSYERYVYTVM